MNELKVFENQEFGKVRVVEVNGESYFVGKDVAECLGYSNSSKAVSTHVDEEDRILETIEAHAQNGNVVKTQTALINESGLYSLILGSKLSSAKEFKRWVTSEVLPSIRRNGAYMTDNTLEQALTSPDFLIQLATKLKAEKELRIKEQEARIRAEQTIERNKGKVLFAESVEATNDGILVREMAKLLIRNGIDTGEKKLYQWFRQNGWLIKAAGRDWNQPTQIGMERGLFTVKEVVVNHGDWIETKRTTLVTGKGQVYFMNKFLDKKAEQMRII